MTDPNGAAIYGAPWIPSIYPLYVSIFLPAPWIPWDLQCRMGAASLFDDLFRLGGSVAAHFAEPIADKFPNYGLVQKQGILKPTNVNVHKKNHDVDIFFRFSGTLLLNR